MQINSQSVHTRSSIVPSVPQDAISQAAPEALQQAPSRSLQLPENRMGLSGQSSPFAGQTVSPNIGLPVRDFQRPMPMSAPGMGLPNPGFQRTMPMGVPGLGLPQPGFNLTMPMNAPRPQSPLGQPGRDMSVILRDPDMPKRGIDSPKPQMVESMPDKISAPTMSRDDKAKEMALEKMGPSPTVSGKWTDGQVEIHTKSILSDADKMSKPLPEGSGKPDSLRNRAEAIIKSQDKEKSMMVMGGPPKEPTSPMANKQAREDRINTLVNNYQQLSGLE